MSLPKKTDRMRWCLFKTKADRRNVMKIPHSFLKEEMFIMNWKI